MTRHRISNLIRVRVAHQSVVSEVEVCLAILNSVSYVKVDKLVRLRLVFNLPYIAVSIKHSFERLAALLDSSLLRVVGSGCVFELSLSLVTILGRLHLYS